MNMPKKVIIIGGGLSGLSLGVNLVDKGYRVEIIEKKSYLGGRASNKIDKITHDPVPIGPHICINSYESFLKFLHKIGASADICWERSKFLDYVYHGEHYHSKASRLPAPWYMMPMFFGYKYLNIFDKLSNIVFTSLIYFSSKTKLERFDEVTAYAFLKKYGVTDNSIAKLWRFFVLSMLNVPLEICSASEFCLLLKFWMEINHGSIGFTKVGLGDLYTQKASEYIRERGGSFIFNCSLENINFEKAKIQNIEVKDKGIRKVLEADSYVSTLNPLDLRDLLPQDLVFSDYFRPLNSYEPVPYISVNLWFDSKITDLKFWALINDEQSSKYLNTDFYDQSNIYKHRKEKSFITSNIIYSFPYHHLSDKEIVDKTLEELKKTFPKMQAKLVKYEVHRIPYVIYASIPGMRSKKLSIQTPYSNFYLAGDWTYKKIPQCMEAAVRSGNECAEIIVNNTNKKYSI